MRPREQQSEVRSVMTRCALCGRGLGLVSYRMGKLRFCRRAHKETYRERRWQSRLDWTLSAAREGGVTLASMLRRRNISTKYFARFAAMTFTAVCVIFAAWQSFSSTADQSYPWCTQGDLQRCYYTTWGQCEQTVDYHGFCVANPSVTQQRKGDATH